MSASVADWTRIMNQARVKLTGVSDGALQAELFDVCHEFYSKSSSWLESLLVPIVPNVTTYALVPTTGVAIRLVGVALIDLTNPRMPPSPRGGTMPAVGLLQLTEIPSANSTYLVTVAKTVVLPVDRNGFPVISHLTLPIYGTGILDGVLGRMMLQPNKSYSSPTTVTYHLKRFDGAIQQARVATMRQNAVGTQAWVYPQQFATVSQRGGVSVGSDTSFTS